MGNKLEEGTLVRVYQKPLTGENAEGVARLVENISPDDGNGISVWMVVFTGENQPYRRTINIENAFPPSQSSSSVASCHVSFQMKGKQKQSQGFTSLVQAQKFMARLAQDENCESYRLEKNV